MSIFRLWARDEKGSGFTKLRFPIDASLADTAKRTMEMEGDLLTERIIRYVKSLTVSSSCFAYAETLLIRIPRMDRTPFPTTIQDNYQTILFPPGVLCFSSFIFTNTIISVLLLLTYRRNDRTCLILCVSTVGQSSSMGSLLSLLIQGRS